jgi:hypothetical protein
METMKKRLILNILTMLIITGITAEAQRFTASVSRNPVSTGERFQVTYSIEGDASGFQAPSFKGFTFLSGPSQSQSMQIINGQVSRSMSYSFILQAGDPGKYTIPPASITVNGKKISSNSIDVTVTKSNAPAAQQQGKSEANQQAEAEKIINENLFLTLSVSKSEAYVGEGVYVVYKLFKHPNLQLLNLGPAKTPVFNGFWAQELETVKNLDWSNELHNGVRFQTAILKRLILLPQRAGNLVVEPLELTSTVRLRVQRQQRSRDPWDDFFSDPFANNFKDFEYNIKTRTATVKVKELPPGAPPGFNGAVGNLSMKAWFDKTKTRANEPVTLKVQISGGGNLKLVDPPALSFPTDFDSYDPKIADNLTYSQDGFAGSKTFEYILIPRHEGKFDFQPVSFTYFDLSAKKYVTLTSEAFTIDVAKGDGSESQTAISGVTKEELKYLGKDIRYIKDNTSFTQGENRFFGSAAFLGLSISPLLLFILFVVLRRKQIEENRNASLVRNRRANKIARKRLSVAKDYMVRNDRNKFYEEINRAFWGYLADKLDIPFSDLNKDTASKALISRNMAEEMVQQLMALIDESEFARFAPGAAGEDMNDIYSRSADMIAKLEGMLK